MKKIGTISVNACSDGLNYGTLFLNYALYQYLSKFENTEVENINFIHPTIENINRKYPVLGYLKQKKFSLAFLYTVGFISRIKRYNNFVNFINKNLKQSPLYTLDSLSKAKLDYDACVCGSDTIWSTNFFGNKFVPAYFLSLPSMKNIKKVSYAVSMDDDFVFTNENRDVIKTMISDFSALSCREKYVADQIQTLTSLPVKHMLDPVFLLPSSHYQSLMSPRLIKKPYLLVYFVRSINYKANIILVKKYAKKYNLKIVELSKYPWHCLTRKTFAGAKPEDFLSLIYNAEIIFTDSFHGTCFSIIFKKDFYIFYKKGNRRIKSLCEKLLLGNRVLANASDVPSNERINYEPTCVKLNEWLSDATNFLKENVID